MTPTDINRRLALAIGYAPGDVSLTDSGDIYAWRNHKGAENKTCYEFDYRDAHTIYAISEEYKMFPRWSTIANSWWLQVQGPPSRVWHTCPRACVALATIEAHDRGLI